MKIKIKSNKPFFSSFTLRELKKEYYKYKEIKYNIHNRDPLNNFINFVIFEFGGTKVTIYPSLKTIFNSKNLEFSYKFLNLNYEIFKTIINEFNLPCNNNTEAKLILFSFNISDYIKQRKFNNLNIIDSFKYFIFKKKEYIKKETYLDFYLKEIFYCKKMFEFVMLKTEKFNFDKQIKLGYFEIRNNYVKIIKDVFESKNEYLNFNKGYLFFYLQ